MWVFSITEEFQGGASKDKAKYVLIPFESREEGKEGGLAVLRTALLIVIVGGQLGGDYCGLFAEQLHNDGARLSESTEGPWSGEANECKEHEAERRMTYWLKPMNESEYGDTVRLFEQAFPGAERKVGSLTKQKQPDGAGVR